MSSPARSGRAPSFREATTGGGRRDRADTIHEARTSDRPSQLRARLVMLLRLTLVLALIATVSTASAQDAKTNEPPKAPDGWKLFTAKDRGYQFLAPAEVKRHGTRSPTFK